MAGLAEQGIAVLKNHDGDVVGMGVVIDETHILTCAHVVNAALGRPVDAATTPRRRVPVAFPLEHNAATQSASVDVWLPIRDAANGRSSGVEDIAVLGLKRPVPAPVGIAGFIDPPDPAHQQFRAFGFAVGSSTGNWAEGKVLGAVSGGWLQIDGLRETGIFVQPGFSGGAVYADELGGTIGIVVAANTNSAQQVAYLIPTRVLKQACGWLPVHDSAANTKRVERAPVDEVARDVLLAKLRQLTATDFGSLRTALRECRGHVDADGAVIRRVDQLVRILEPYREDAGYHYFVMEYLAGGTFLSAVESDCLDQAPAAASPLRQGQRITSRQAAGIGRTRNTHTDRRWACRPRRGRGAQTQQAETCHPGNHRYKNSRSHACGMVPAHRFPLRKCRMYNHIRPSSPRLQGDGGQAPPGGSNDGRGRPSYVQVVFALARAGA